MNFNDEIRNIIIAATKEAYPAVDINSIAFVVEIPKDRKMGDYATNVALQVCKVLKGNPQIIAQTIIDHMPIKDSIFDHVEKAGAGFINFFVKTSSLADIVPLILKQGKEYGHTDYGKHQTYNVEFVSANPTGKLHLGHARQAAIGDSLCRILSSAGYKVTREYYVNDAGGQVDNLAMSLNSRYQELVGGKPVPIPEDGYHGEDVIDTARIMVEEIGDKYKDKQDKESYEYFKKRGIELKLDQIKKDLALYRVVMDVYSSEAYIRSQGMIEHALEIFKELKISYEKEGATWFKSTDFGDDKDRVLIKSDGAYTYLTPDIAYHINKLERGYDYLVDILGADHHGYIARLKAAIMALGHNQDKLEVEIVQMVRLIKDGEEFKMSKRTGNAITLTDLCAEVGIDATRYFFIARSGSTHMDFDVGLATSKTNDNPVYYAQYAHARMCSIIAADNEASEHLPEPKSYQFLKSEEENELLLHLREYPDTIIDAAKTREPYKIANYIQKLASKFHSFYGACRVIDMSKQELSAERLALVKATKIVLASALDLIGVSAPESM